MKRKEFNLYSNYSLKYYWKRGKINWQLSMLGSNNRICMLDNLMDPLLSKLNNYKNHLRCLIRKEQKLEY